jgi:putative ABC transport system substrate-binding protein
MRRRQFLAGAAILSVASPALAQSRPTRRLAIVSLAEPLQIMREGGGNRYYDVLFQELARLGHIEGKTLAIDRYSLERAGPAVLPEVIGSRPDVIYVIGREALAVKQATSTIPVVVLGPDPIAFGLVTSLARPGGNVTGVSVDTGSSIHGKRLGLLRELVPSISRVAFVAFRPAWASFFGVAAREAAAAIGLELIPALVDTPPSDDQYRRVMEEAAREGADGAMVTDNPDAMARRAVIAAAVAAARLPAIYPFKESVEAGGLMAYSFDLADLNRRAASNIDAILKGKNPGDIPFYQNSNFQLFINTKTASAMGLTIPPTLLARADEVIE